MEEDKNIRLTLVHPNEGRNNEITVDLMVIFGYIRRLFTLWLAFAVALGAVSLGVGIQRQNLTSDGKTAVLVSYTYPTAKNGLDPNGETLDVNKIRSPAMIESALSSLGMDPTLAVRVRNCISIEGVVPDSTVDEQTLYYDLFSRSGNAAIAQTLLEMAYEYTQYIVTFDYQSAGLSGEEGISLLNEVVKAYQSYFTETYLDFPTAGISINVIDYQDYDYAEAVNIFTSALNSISSSVTDIPGQYRETFRSSNTGYTFGDLSRITQSLRNTELNRVSAFLALNPVSRRGADAAIEWYRWQLEEARVNRTVLESRLAALTEAIARYQKAPVLYTIVDNAGSAENASPSRWQPLNREDLNENYDDMISQQLSVQNQISSETATIQRCQEMIERFQNAPASQPSDVETIEGYLSDLNQKVNQLIEIVDETAEEYYSRMVSDSLFRVLVPASSSAAPPLLSKNAMMMIAGLEGGLLLVWFGAAAVLGIRDSNRKEKAAS